MSASVPKSIDVAPAPWELKGTIYSFLFWVSPQETSSIGNDKEFLYSPLEAESSFSDGAYLGGLASIQVIRYTESPVGPYDELILVPGKFEYAAETDAKDNGFRLEMKKNLRVTRAYVSQEKTCWNGRNNWNIPKNLAHFEFKPLSNSAVAISVYPLVPGDAGAEWTASKTPYFSATYRPIQYLPAFPCSTDLFGYVGIDMTLVQPPVPPGKVSSCGELAGSKQWCSVVPYEWSPKTSMGWWDLKRGTTTEEDALLGGAHDAASNDASVYENWWPGMGRWRIGMLMENAIIKFPEGKHWDGPER